MPAQLCTALPRALQLLALMLASTAAGAQAPTMPAAPTPSEAQVIEAYNDLDWTGRPSSAAIVRKEAGAALVEGRRRCARQRDPAERRQCLQIVNEDYQSMISRYKSRSARR